MTVQAALQLAQHEHPLDLVERVAFIWQMIDTCDPFEEGAWRGALRITRG